MKSRVSSTVTKPTKRVCNPRPRKYASASERQAAYRARAPEVCFRAEPKTVETLDRIAETLDQSRADVLLSMTKFALANHDWARFGLTHKPLPFEYGVNPIMATKKRKPTPAQLAARERFAEMARSGGFAKGRKRNPAKKTHVWRITVFDDDGKPAKVTTDSTEQGALLYAKSKADANLSGEIHYILPKSERLEFWFDGTGIHPAGSYGNRPIYTTRRAALKTNPAKKTVSQKISQLTREGYPQKQAVAIALNEERAGKVRRNPASTAPFKFVCIAPLEYSGSKYGIDERTPVTLKFAKTEPAASTVYACYQLPASVVKNDDFQNFAYHNKVLYMSIAQLRAVLKGYAK